MELKRTKVERIYKVDITGAAKDKLTVLIEALHVDEIRGTLDANGLSDYKVTNWQMINKAVLLIKPSPNIKEIKVFKFEELTDELKAKVLQNLCDINVDHNWWDATYEGAEESGLKLTGFDIDRASYCNGKFTTSATECAEYILKEYGKECELYKAAKIAIDAFNELKSKEDADDELEEAEDEFLKQLLECYLDILKSEYEYLTSEEAIIGTIEANEYTFNEQGKIA